MNFNLKFSSDKVCWPCWKIYLQWKDTMIWKGLQWHWGDLKWFKLSIPWSFDAIFSWNLCWAIQWPDFQGIEGAFKVFLLLILKKNLKFFQNNQAFNSQPKILMKIQLLRAFKPKILHWESPDSCLLKTYHKIIKYRYRKMIRALINTQCMQSILPTCLEFQIQKFIYKLLTQRENSIAIWSILPNVLIVYIWSEFASENFL